jgi:hypothetical protein
MTAMHRGLLRTLHGIAAVALFGVAFSAASAAAAGGGDLCGTPTTPQCPRSPALIINCPPTRPLLVGRDGSDC